MCLVICRGGWGDPFHLGKSSISSSVCWILACLLFFFFAIWGEGEHAWLTWRCWLPDGPHLLPPCIVFISDRETDPLTKWTYGLQNWEAVWEVGWGRKECRVLSIIKRADITLKVIVLLILIRDKSHNGWYRAKEFPPHENPMRWTLLGLLC